MVDAQEVVPGTRCAQLVVETVAFSTRRPRQWIPPHPDVQITARREGRRALALSIATTRRGRRENQNADLVGRAYGYGAVDGRRYDSGERDSTIQGRGDRAQPVTGGRIGHEERRERDATQQKNIVSRNSGASAPTRHMNAIESTPPAAAIRAAVRAGLKPTE